MRLELIPRVRLGPGRTVLTTGASVGIALLLGAVVLTLCGVPPLEAYHAIFSASLLGGGYALSDTAVKATPLLLCGLGCAVAFRARLWNVGAEGQLLMGAWAATGVASFWLPAGLPPVVVLTLMALAGALAGAAWGALAGLLKAWLDVSEIITSLMMVYIAQKLLNYFVFGVWSEGGFPHTPLLPRAYWLPRLSDHAEAYPALSGLTAHAGILFGLALCLALWLALRWSVWGFEQRILGDSPAAARYVGLWVKGRVVSTMAISGALAGLAGMSEVAGVVHRLQDNFSPGSASSPSPWPGLGGWTPGGLWPGRCSSPLCWWGPRRCSPTASP